jgi:hypothetical protein
MHTQTNEREAGMWKRALVGAVALTTGMISLAPAQAQSQVASLEAPASAGPIVKEAHIARLKSVLNLTPSQNAYWAPVESALRALAREQKAEATGFVQRMGDRAASAAGTAMRLRRLAAAARPLIQSLDDTQKQKAMILAQNLGFGSLIASF